MMRYRIYAYKISIWNNEVPKRVRAPRDKGLYRAKACHNKKWTLHVFAKRDKVVYWELRDHNADDTEVQQVALKALKKIKKVYILIWDRLGRSGKSKNPSKQHYN